jgi:hypothetical protein
VAAAALQSAREDDMQMIRFEASSHMYEELFEKIRDDFLRGDSWTGALVSFANAGPLNGDVDQNRKRMSPKCER